MSDPTPNPAPAPQADPPAPAPTPAPTPAPANPGDAGAGQHVPYERFKQVNDQLRDLKTQLQQLTGEKDQEKAGKQTLEQQIQQIQTELASERAEKLRLKVAGEKKLPAELVDRLRGDTAEDLAADADRLLAFLKPAAGPGVPPGGSTSKAPKLDLSNMTAAEVRKARAEGKI